MSESGSKRFSGGVVLRDMPPLIGNGPQLIMVQPQDLLEGDAL